MADAECARINSKADATHSKMEEILEIKALRRIIDAYLNYAEAAESDVRRWERSYAKLEPKHKELLRHLPVKYMHIRRCIATNSFFIYNMLQAFEPPFDINQDCDLENAYIASETKNESTSRNIEGENPQACESRVECSHDDNPSTKQNSLAANESLENSADLSGRTGENIIKRRLDIDHHEELYKLKDCSTSKLENMDRSCADAEMHNNKTSQVEQKFSEKQMMGIQNQFCCHSSTNSYQKINCALIDEKDSLFQMHVSPADIDKVRCIIRNIVRDWAPEGLTERKQCYEPILEQLKRYFPNRSKESPPTCLVPGAGLGRLALEISCLGFICQGNEFSYFMMICSSFILNHTHKAMEWVVHPWIHSNCNSLSDSDQLRPVYFPDLYPGSAGITDGFSMCAGDFVEVYNDPNQCGTWDSVVTCFFIDTAHNVVEYIEIISKVLKDGGIWVNVGPLLYHFAETFTADDELSIELSLEDVKKIAFHHGFELESERTIETTYTANPFSMMQNKYFCAFWTMRKKTSQKSDESPPNRS